MRANRSIQQVRPESRLISSSASHINLNTRPAASKHPFVTKMVYRLFFLFCLECLAPWRILALDPVEELKSFSAFGEIDLSKLAGGEILVARGPFMDFPRGISAQACFVVMAPPEKTAKLYQTWDASHHESLKLYSHCHIQSPLSDEDFKPLN